MGIFSKWSAEPSTPKLKSVSLPDDEDRTSPASRPPSDKIATLKKVVADSRPTTPRTFFRTRRDSTAKPKSSMKTKSTTNDTDKASPPIDLSDSSKPISVNFQAGGPFCHERCASLAGSSSATGSGLPESQSRMKSIHKGWPSSHPRENYAGTQTVAFPSKMDNDACGAASQVRPAMGSVPSKSYPPSRSLDHNHEYSRRRHHSTADTSPSPPSHLSSRRAETPGPSTWTTVKKVPTKGEAISLTWPLVEYNYKRRRPLLYFDIAFDPDIPENIRAKKYGEGVFMNLTVTEREMPVCTHDIVTDMHIVYPKLPSWPIRVHRSEGIRCIDVLSAIYKTFHRQLSKDEVYQLIPAEHMHAFVPAFEQRCRDSPRLTEYEKRQGMRRVDLLRGTRIFSGLKQQRDGSWILELAHPTGP